MIEERDGDEIWEAVVGILLGEDESLVALLSAADDAVSDVKDIDVDRLDVRSPRIRDWRWSSSAASIAVCEWISAL